MEATTMKTPPDEDGAKGEVVLKMEMEKRGRKWVTWQSIGEKTVVGSEVVHDTMRKAWEWIKNPRTN